MRIGYDAKRTFNNAAGLGNYGRTLLDNMLTYHPDNGYHLFTPDVSLPEVYDLYKEQVHIHQAGSGPKAYWRSWGIAKDIAENKLDIYHGVTHELPRNISKSKCRSVVTIHDLIFRRCPEYFPWTDRMIYHQKWKHAISHADKIIAVSENTKQDILHYYPTDSEKIQVIYTSCHKEFYDSYQGQKHEIDGLPQDYLLSVGSIEPRKNHQTLLRALASIPASDRPALVIVGRGRPSRVAQLHRQISHLSLSKWVQIRSDIANDNIRELYERAFAMVYPSFYEGHGLPITEALLCRLPVVASGTSSMREAGGPSTQYIDPQDADALAYKISSVLQDSELRKKMMDDGYRYAEKTFAPASVTKQMYTAYQSIL